MEQNYNEVPTIITGKDLDYLSDMFNWNYAALKKVNSFNEKVTDEELKEMFNKAYDLFNSNLNSILSILNGGLNGQQ